MKTIDKEKKKAHYQPSVEWHQFMCFFHPDEEEVAFILSRKACSTTDVIEIYSSKEGFENLDISVDANEVYNCTWSRWNGVYPPEAEP